MSDLAQGSACLQGAPLEPQDVQSHARGYWDRPTHIQWKADFALVNILEHLKNKRYRIVLELRDARCPQSTAHPTLAKVVSRATQRKAHQRDREVRHTG